MWYARVVLFGISVILLVESKRFDTRCKLVREFQKVGVPKDYLLGQWVCLAEKVSNRDTGALTTKGGKKYYGLYQIPDQWCKSGKPGGDCNVKCEALLDDDIRDDTACANLIFQREGFKYWKLWETRCKNDYTITEEIYKCPELQGFRRLNAEKSSDLLKYRRMLMNSSFARGNTYGVVH